MTDVSVAAPTRQASARSSLVRPIVIGLGVLLLVFGVLDFARTGRGDVATKSWSLDYDINLIAAQRLVDHQDIYSRAGSIATGRELVGPQMRYAYQDPFSSYIGTPVVALTHVPFLAFDHVTGMRWFRVLSLVEMIGAIILVAWSMRASARLPAALFGIAALFWGFPTVKSIAMGQANGMVMLAFALAVWATVRRRWGLVGVALGIAAVLKVTPVLLVAYLLIRGRHRVASAAAATAAGLVAVAAAVGRPGLIVDWVVNIAPQVSKGAISGYNQSVVAALARLTATHVDFTGHTGPGAWYMVAYVVWGLAIYGLWRWRRGRTVDPMELGILVLVVLFSGPLTWDHYATWALIPFVLVCDIDRWRGLRMIEGAALLAALTTTLWLFYHGIMLPTRAEAAADWWWRVVTTRYTVATLLLTCVAVWLLARSPVPDPATPEWPDERDTAVGTALPMVATGVHERG
jgi:alpha-1,2-mannosyltransferase